MSIQLNSKLFVSGLIFVTAQLFTAATGSAVGEVPLRDIVPEYMGDGLETAITPTPKDAKLQDFFLKLNAAPVCVCPPELATAYKELMVSGFLARKKESDAAVVAAAKATDKKKNPTVTKTARDLEKEWPQLLAKSNKPGWPSMIPFALEIVDLFPGAEFASTPPAGGKPVIFLFTEDQRAAYEKILGKPLPPMPKVEDEECAKEAYVLVSDAGSSGEPRIAICGATPWGVLWGVETLRQMVFQKEGKSYVRQGTITDWPSLFFRGGKRMQTWYARFKGNSKFTAHGGYHYDFAMHALDGIHFDFVSGRTVHVDKMKADFQKAVADGVDYYQIDLNDRQFMTPDKEGEPFPGKPAETIKYLFKVLKEENERLKANVKLGYMGSGYSVQHRGADKEGNALRDANALENAKFISMNGIWVFTDKFYHEGAQAYLDAFGFKGKLFNYDCGQCTGRMMEAFDFKDNEVWKHLYGISQQNPPPISFCTMADYAWNPEAYNPQKSFKIVLREFADRDPAFYKMLYDYLTYLSENDFVHGYTPREKALELEEKNTKAMLDRFEALRPFLEKGKMAQTAMLLEGNTNMASLGYRPQWRKDNLDLMKKHGYKEYHVGRASKINIDGDLSEEDWKKAAVMDTFITGGQLINTVKDMAKFSAIPADGRSITVRSLYDDTALYISAEVKGVAPEVIADMKTALEGKTDEKLLARGVDKQVGCFEFFFDATLENSPTWQILCGPPDRSNQFKIGKYFDPKDPFQKPSEVKPEFKYVIKGDDSYVFECKIPFWTQIETPKKGSMWDVQLQLNKVLAKPEKDDKTAIPKWLHWWSYQYNHGFDGFDRRNGVWIFE